MRPGRQRTPAADWTLCCPVCREALSRSDSRVAPCARCGHVIENVDDIWRTVPADRLERYSRFLETYTRVRVAEGRAGYDATIVRALPACPAAHPHAPQWRIRSKSYAVLLTLLRQNLRPCARILDLGAGTGWLCNRLHQQGFVPCAVDLSVDTEDGLRAARHFNACWPRLQAEFDRLPLIDGEADCVIFNASFHYCLDQEQALREALRVLAPGGVLLIVDTPIYRNEASGRQMLEEQQAYFERLIGERSNSLATSGFLTWERLASLAGTLGLEWHVERPWYGLRWALRPLLATLRGKREPAKFALLQATRPVSSAE